MRHMEKETRRLKFARKPASSNKWVGLLGALLYLDVFGGENTYLPVAGNWFFSPASTVVTRWVTTKEKSGIVGAPDFRPYF